MGKKKRGNIKKPRSDSVQVTTTGEITGFNITYDPATDSVVFDTPVENTFHEVSYERSKGRKVVSRTALNGDDLPMSASNAVASYDQFVAVDTNTKVVQGRELSVTGVVLGELVDDPASGDKAVKWYTPFCLEFNSLAAPKERIGWMMALSELTRRGYLKDVANTAVIVDAHLGDIGKINRREQAVFNGYYLPKSFKLLYASADVGKEYMSNQLISSADKVATQVIDYFAAHGAELNVEFLNDSLFKGYRLVWFKS